MNDPTHCRVCGTPVRLRADGTVMGHNDDSLSACPGSNQPPAADPEVERIQRNMDLFAGLGEDL